ncbi:putative NLR family CARD domain-containing protein 4 [Apostichopus japonicus]|uniref:Putative NLR family CARD domain-containing protein 4 n=1 Tax=Stichopus japonicus TaxID=307972 RepID=A0A2G8LBH3_STIJA|nr:putative NLR family CARD domain-containing protein 4 [Apostichopus japonicus]
MYSAMLFFIVKPAITIPVIEECSNTYGTTCVKSTSDSVEVNCFVRDSRPAVKLSWSSLLFDRYQANTKSITLSMSVYVKSKRNGHLPWTLYTFDPTPVFPVIDGCNHQQYCVLEKQPQDVLTCSVLGIRPKVALEWRAFREETAIDFTQHQFKETQMGDLYDISLTVNFDFTQTTQNKVTVECRAVGENAELFSLSTKVDLLFPNVLPTEQRSHTSTITIIAVVVIMMMIIITAAVVILCRLRARKMKQNKPGDTENEDIPMMENTNAKHLVHIGLYTHYILVDDIVVLPNDIFVYLRQAQWDKLSSYQELVKENCLKTKRQILEGEPGYGKSTLTLQLLYDWCKSQSKTSSGGVDVIIYLRLRQLGGVESIFSAIRQFILPRDSDISEEDIKEILNHMSSVLVLLDGFNEYPDQESTNTDIYHIMKKDMFQGFNVILTTRRSSVPKDFAPHSDRVRLTGFGEEAHKKYVEKAVFEKCGEAVNELLKKLEENPVLDAFCQVPLFFVMFAHMTYENEHSLTFNSVTSFYLNTLHV